MNTGKPISDDVRNELTRLARKMHHDGKKRLKSTHRLCPGTLYTSFKSGSIGGVSGVEFTAEIVTAQGEAKVVFIMRHFDVEYDGPWVSTPLEPLEELAAEYDYLRETSSGRRSN